MSTSFFSIGPTHLTIGKFIHSFIQTPLAFRQLSHAFYVGTLSPDSDGTIPTVTDNLFASGAIQDHLVAVYLLPLNTSNVSDADNLNADDNLSAGEISWGLCIYLLKP
jgi:hypothetical protein